MNLFRKMALAAALAGFSPSPLFACAACAGGKTSAALAQGMNWGIFTLLAIVALMLTSIATFFIFLIRREAAAQEETVPEETLSGAKI